MDDCACPSSALERSASRLGPSFSCRELREYPSSSQWSPRAPALTDAVHKTRSRAAVPPPPPCGWNRLIPPSRAHPAPISPMAAAPSGMHRAWRHQKARRALRHQKSSYTPERTRARRGHGAGTAAAGSRRRHAAAFNPSLPHPSFSIDSDACGTARRRGKCCDRVRITVSRE
jgi:hypothetical protein